MHCTANIATYYGARLRFWIEVEEIFSQPVEAIFYTTTLTITGPKRESGVSCDQTFLRFQCGSLLNNQKALQVPIYSDWC